LQEASAVATEDLWVPHQRGRSIRYFTLPRPLLLAYRLWSEKQKQYASLELHYLPLDCFACGKEEASKLQGTFAKLAIFTQTATNATPAFQCADIVPIDATESCYLNILERWLYLHQVPQEWKKRYMLGVYSLLKV
jgi:hypothetical protein